MPILTREEYEQETGSPVDLNSDGGMKFAGEGMEADAEPTLGQTMGANMRSNNPLGNFIANHTDQPLPLTAEEARQDYDPYADMPESIVGTELEADYLSESISPRHSAHWVRNNDRLQKDRKMLSDSSLGANLLTGLPTALLDPLMLPALVIPGAAALNFSKFANMGIKSALAIEAGVTAGTTIASEAALHAQQADRTIEESVYAVGGSVLFTGLLSAGVYGLKQSAISSITKRLDADMDKIDANPTISKVDLPKHASAAEAIDEIPAVLEAKIQDKYRKEVEAGRLTPEEAQRAIDVERIATVKNMTVTKHPRLYRTLGWISPSIRLATSQHHGYRLLGAQLVNDPLQRVGGQYGVTPGFSVEAMRDMTMAELAVARHNVMGKGYVTYRKSVADGEKALTKDEFSRELSRALRTGDKHDNATIQAAVKQVRSEVMEPIQARLLERGLIDKEYVGLDTVTREQYEKLYMDNSGNVFEEVEALANSMFDENGLIKANKVSKLDKETRQLLEGSGAITSRAAIPTGDESYLHRLWDTSAIEKNREAFEDHLANLFKQKGLKAIDDNLAAQRLKVEELEAELKVQSTDVDPKKSEFTAEKKVAIEAKQKTISNLKGRIRTAEKKYMELANRDNRTTAKVEEVEAVRNEIDKLDASIIKHQAALRDIRKTKMTAKMKMADAKWKLKLSESVAVTDRKLIDAQVSHAAREIRKAIMSEDYNVVNSAKTFKAGPLKARSIDIKSEDVEDFMVHDLGEIMDSWAMHVSPQLAISEKFDLQGKDIDTHVQDLIRSTMDEADKTIRSAPVGEQAKLRKHQKQAAIDIEAMFEQLMNRYKNPDNPDGFFHQTGENLRAFNFVTKLGMMTVSALPDVGHVIMRHGMLPVAKSLAKLGNLGDEAKANRAFLSDLSIAADLANSGRARKMMLGENGKKFGGDTKFRNRRDKLVDTFSLFSGMNHWNAGLKTLTGHVYSADIARSAMKALDGKMSAKDIARFTNHGLSEKDLIGIGKELRDGGMEEMGGSVIPKLEAWSNQGLAEKFKMAVFQETENSVVTPGVGDIPLISRTPMGKVITQFKSFAMAANNRVLLASIDDFTYNRAVGSMAMVGLGYVAYAAKQGLKGEDVATDYDTVIKEGIDRSGLFAFWSEPNGMIEKLTGKSMYNALGIEGRPLSRMASRNMVGTIAGVSAGAIADVSTIATAASQGKFTEADLRSARRVVPFNNHFMLHRAFTAGEESLGGQ